MARRWRTCSASSRSNRILRLHRSIWLNARSSSRRRLRSGSDVGAQHAAPVLIVCEPPQESVEAAFAAVGIVADVGHARFGERGVELGARIGGASAGGGFFGGGRFEQVGGERHAGA